MMNDLSVVASDVQTLKEWRKDVVDPSLEKVDKLWEDRVFFRGAFWVIGIICSATFALILLLTTWCLNHLKVNAQVIDSTTQSSTQQNAEIFKRR
jgi:hypothetical protein